MKNLNEQKHKLGERIFEYYEYGEGWGKKKGMHWITFERESEKYNNFQKDIDNLICNHLGIK